MASHFYMERNFSFYDDDLNLKPYHQTIDLIQWLDLLSGKLHQVPLCIGSGKYNVWQKAKVCTFLYLKKGGYGIEIEWLRKEHQEIPWNR